MKKIGIIGSTGFLGTEVFNFFAAKKIFKLLKFSGDIRKQKQTETFVKKCDLIINLAATRDEQKILETNINGALNIINACYSHKKGFLTCVERKLGTDAYSVSKNVQKSIISEYNKLGFQGFLMKLDPVVGGREYYSKIRNGAFFIGDDVLLELVSPEDVCKWIYSFSDAFLMNGVFFTKEFEFWDPVRISVKEMVALLNGRVVENVSLEHAQKILKCLGKSEDV